MNELENWKSVLYRIREEGMHYCFHHYSNWSEIDDKEFHELRTDYIEIGRDIKEYIEQKIKQLENE